MAVTITVRGVPDDLRDVLAARAAGSGRSLQEYLLAELSQMTARPTVEDALAEVRRRARALPAVDVDDLLRDVAADRR